MASVIRHGDDIDEADVYETGLLIQRLDKVAEDLPFKEVVEPSSTYSESFQLAVKRVREDLLAGPWKVFMEKLVLWELRGLLSYYRKLRREKTSDRVTRWEQWGRLWGRESSDTAFKAWVSRKFTAESLSSSSGDCVKHGPPKQKFCDACGQDGSPVGSGVFSCSGCRTTSVCAHGPCYCPKSDCPNSMGHDGMDCT